MAKIRSGSVILSNGQRIYIGDTYISSTTMSGITDMHVDSYYGDGTYLTGIPRTLIDLLDTPVTYSGSAGKYIKVNSSENGLEFVTVSGSESDYYEKTYIDTVSGTMHSQIAGIEISIDNTIDKMGVTTVTSGSSSVSVSFASAFDSSDYVLSTILSNTVDTPLDLYSMITTSKSAGGFTVLFSGEMDYSNYYLEWVAVTSGIGGGSV